MAEYKDNRKLNFLLPHLEYHNTYKKPFNNEEEKGKKPPPPLRVRVSSSGGRCQ